MVTLPASSFALTAKSRKIVPASHRGASPTHDNKQNLATHAGHRAVASTKQVKSTAAPKQPKHTAQIAAAPSKTAAKHVAAHEAAREPVREHPLSSRARLAELKKAASTTQPIEIETPQVDAQLELAPVRPLQLPSSAPRPERAAARTEETEAANPRDAVTPLRGSHESLVRQNEKSEAEGLERIEDDDDLNDRIAHKLLVPVPVSSSLTINGNLPQNRRYCRPWTAAFLTDLANAHEAEFHKPFEVSSAVRTVAYQKQLMRVNGNAAPADGDIASPHLTGGTIDIAKQGMSRKELAWMRSNLLDLQQTGMIDVEEEFRQACFHITVYKSYLPPQPELETAALHIAKGGTARLTKKAARRPRRHKHQPVEMASQGQ
jgi:hypothetical protein